MIKLFQFLKKQRKQQKNDIVVIPFKSLGKYELGYININIEKLKKDVGFLLLENEDSIIIVDKKRKIRLTIENSNCVAIESYDNIYLTYLGDKILNMNLYKILKKVGLDERSNEVITDGTRVVFLKLGLEFHFDRLSSLNDFPKLCGIRPLYDSSDHEYFAFFYKKLDDYLM